MHSPSGVASSRADLPALLRTPARDAHARRPSERILVPFDGSQAAQRALRHAIAISARARLQIDLVNVQPPVMAGDVTLLTSARAVEENRRKLGRAVLWPATLALQAHEVPYTASVVLGDAAVEIAKAAHRFACTRIVMGTRAMGVVRSLFSRSVARRVVKRTSVPVTLVKADSAAPEAAPPAPGAAQHEPRSQRPALFLCRNDLVPPT